MSYKVGDIAPYRNTRGNVKYAKITSFKTVSNGDVWFYGIDTVTKANVWYPAHKSETLAEYQFKIGDEIICVENMGRENELTIDKTYTILSIDYSDFKFDGTFLVSIRNDEGDICDYGGVRFKTKKK